MGTKKEAGKYITEREDIAKGLMTVLELRNDHSENNRGA